jgi:2C-methyl-D-erythritol 2,4-cyclodiphosphate synthase
LLYITNSGVKNSYGLYGPWLEDGTFSRSTLPKGAASFIEKGSEEKLATVTRLVPRSQAETVVNIDETLVLQEPVIEPSAEAMTNPVDKKMAESSTETSLSSRKTLSKTNRSLKIEGVVSLFHLGLSSQWLVQV